MKKMRYLLIILMLLGFSTSIFSQFRGGNGDGYVNAQSLMLLPNVHITPVATVCPGSTLQLNVKPTSTGITYYWTGPNGFYSFEQNPKITNVTSANAGKYKCVITLEQGSPTEGNSDSIIVNVANAIVVNAGEDILEHPLNNPITLSTASVTGGSGSFNYLWTSSPSYSFVNNTLLQATTSVGLTTSAIFKLQVTDATTGCVGKDSLYVSVAGEPLNAIAKVSNSTICEGVATQLDVEPYGGNGLYTYEWTAIPADPNLTPILASQKNPIVNPAVSTAYTVKVTAGTENVSKSVNVIVNLQSVGGFVSVTGNSEVCKGETTSLSLSSASGTVQWQYSYTGSGGWTNIIGATGITYNTQVLNTTTFYRATTRNGNCTYALSTIDTVVVNTTPTSTMSGYKEICEGTETTIKVAFTGKAPWSFQYTDGTTPVTINDNYSNPLNINVSPSVNTAYTIINLNDAKCTGVSYHEANIFVTPAPTKFDIVSLNNKYCAGQNGVTIGLSGSENNVNYQLLRNGNPYGAVKPGTGNAIEWYNVINGTYTVNAINSLTTCEGMMNGNFTVIQNALPTAATITSNGICGSGNVLMNATLTGDGNQVEFSENGGTTIHGVVNYPDPYQYSTSLITAGTSKTIHVRTVVDSTGCASAWTNSAPAIAYLPSVGGDLNAANSSICLGSNTGNIILTNKKGNVTSWEKSQDLNNWTSISSIDTFLIDIPDAIGTWKYRTIVKNGECNEAYSDTLDMFVKASPTAAISDNATICNGSNANITLNLTGSSPWNVIYSDGIQNDTLNGLTNNIEIYTVNPATTTTYSLVSVSDANCNAAATGSVLITVNYAPNFQFIADTIDVESYPYTLDAGAGWDSLRWNDGTTNQTLQVNVDGEYNVTVWDNGCSNMDNVYVRLSDGINNLLADKIYIYPNPAKDYITVKSNLYKNNYKYEIVNNHGKIVYEGKLINASQNINISTIAEGIYLLKIYTNSGISINKIVKQH